VLNDNVANALSNVLRNQDHSNVFPFNQLTQLLFDDGVGCVLIHYQKVLLTFGVALTDSRQQQSSHCG